MQNFVDLLNEWPLLIQDIFPDSNETNPSKRFLSTSFKPYNFLILARVTQKCNLGNKSVRLETWLTNLINLIVTQKEVSVNIHYTISRSWKGFVLTGKKFQTSIQNFPKWLDTLQKSCSIYYKIFKVYLTILERLDVSNYSCRIVNTIHNTIPSTSVLSS